MRAENYWEQFLSTGKIDDYLAYRKTDIPEVKVLNKKSGGSDGDEGVMKRATAGQFYRDDFKG